MAVIIIAIESASPKEIFLFINTYLMFDLRQTDFSRKHILYQKPAEVKPSAGQWLTVTESDVLLRIDSGAVNADLKVKVRSCGVTGGAAQADGLTLCDVLTYAYKSL